MGVLFAGLGDFRVGGVFADVEEEDVGASEGEEVVFEVVPLCTHDGEGVVVSFLLVDGAGLKFETFRGQGDGGVVGGNHSVWIPEKEGAVLHAGEDESIGVGV